MAPKYDEEALKARIKELEEGLIEEAAHAVDPQVLAKAQSMLNFSIMDVQVALSVLEIVPTEEQQIAIEDAIIANKVKALSAKAKRNTRANWK